MKEDNFYDRFESGAWYNCLPLEEQLDILKTYYPIGGVFHWKQPDSSVPDSKFDYKNYICSVEDYILQDKWFILRIKNLDEKTINIRGGQKSEDIHPGFFKPHVWYDRNNKLNDLGI